MPRLFRNKKILLLALISFNLKAEYTQNTIEDLQRADFFLMSKDIDNEYSKLGGERNLAYDGGENSSSLKPVYNYEWQRIREIVDDSNLGFVNRPSSKIRHIARREKEIIYNATYTFDKYGRRFDPRANQEEKEKFVLLQGCSFTYGNGLNDDQTLNHFVNKYSKKYHAYNYAVGATGPNHMLAQLRENKYRDQILQKQGVFIYLFIDSHIQRSNGFMQELGWISSSPYYELENDAVIRNGNFETGSPIRTWFLNFLREKVNYVTRFGKNYPALKQKHIDLTCGLITKSRDEFLKQYPTSKFIFLEHPMVSSIPKELTACLKKKNITIYKTKLTSVINASATTNLKYQIRFDGHPNRLLNDLLAKELSEVILK